MASKPSHAGVLCAVIVLHLLPMQSGWAQDEPNAEEKIVTLFEPQLPDTVTMSGEVVSVKFHCMKSLEGEKLQLSLLFPVGQRGVKSLEKALHQSEQPTTMGFVLRALEAAPHPEEKGELIFRLSPPTISGPPDRWGQQSRFLLRGNRAVTLELFKCVDQSCRDRTSLSNRLDIEVVFS